MAISDRGHDCSTTCGPAAERNWSKSLLKVATAWLGNTPTVALRHYLRTTDDHFEATLKSNDESADEPKATVSQKAAQQVHAATRMDSQSPRTAHEKTPGLPGFASDCDLSQQLEME